MRSQYGIARILVSGVLASCRPDRDLQSAPTCPAVSLIAKWRGFSTLFDILGTAKIGWLLSCHLAAATRLSDLNPHSRTAFSHPGRMSAPPASGLRPSSDRGRSSPPDRRS